MRALIIAIGILVASFAASAQQPSEAVKSLFSKFVERSSLTSLGSAPFDLKLSVSDEKKEHPEFAAEVEIWWASPEKWRREIKSLTFSQTAIQNGQRYTESNSGDYFPWWLHNVITESLNPLPLIELQSVDLPKMPADRCLRWDNTFAAGSDEIGISNLVCFNSDGTLKTMISRTAAANFDNYRAFGTKSIARALESWTFTPDHSNVVLRTNVTDLEPLQETPELFVVTNETPLNTRLRFVSIHESALSPFKLNTPAPQWPVIHNLPNSGIMTVNLKIDREGVVREVGSPISHNVVLSDPARELLKNWRFKPFLVDGAPVQVNVDVAFRFTAKMEPYGANGADFPASTFYERIAKSHKLSDPRVGLGQPFQMDADFQYGQESPGTYREIWHSPTQWLRAATLGSLSITESRDGDHLYRKFTGSKFASKKLDDVLDQMKGLFPRTDFSFIEGDWGVSAVQWDGAAMLRVARGQVDGTNTPTSGQAYWFDSTGLLRGAYVDPDTSVYSDFVQWNGKIIPRTIQVSQNRADLLHIHTSQIVTPTENVGLVLDGVSPTSASDAEAEHNSGLVPAQPVYRPQPVNPQAGQGTVLVDVTIDRHGHVRTATIKESAGNALDDAAIQAALQWEFTPAQMKGITVPGWSTLKFRF